MLYIVFSDVQELERFLTNELEPKRLDECPEECEKACSEGETLYDFIVPAEVIEWRKMTSDARLAELYKCNLSLVPCVAYTGLGFYDNDKIASIISEIFDKLVQYFVEVIKKYHMMFATITATPYEIDSRLIMFAHTRGLKENTYVFYIRSLDKDFLYQLYLRSQFVNHLIFDLFRELSLFKLSPLNPVINPYIPLVNSHIPTMDLLRLRCSKIEQGVSAEGDILCMLKSP